MQTGIVALLFIAGGIRILAGGRKEGGAKGRRYWKNAKMESRNPILGNFTIVLGVVMLTASSSR